MQSCILQFEERRVSASVNTYSYNEKIKKIHWHTSSQNMAPFRFPSYV